MSGGRPFLKILSENWNGTSCTLVQLTIPFTLASQQPSQSKRGLNFQNKRSTEGMTPEGSFDPHVYKDAIGVPKGSLMNSRLEIKQQWASSQYYFGGSQSIKVYIGSTIPIINNRNLLATLEMPSRE
jgi:hypothetical protein